MLHLAFLPFPADGHVRPTLPVIAELVRRGHRVTLATTAKFAPHAEAAGAELLCYSSTLADRVLPPVFTPDYLVREPLRAVSEALATVPVFARHFGANPPDLVLYDVSTYNAGRVLARMWGRPGMQLFPTFASNETFFFPQRIGERFTPDIDPHHPALLEFFTSLARLLADYGLGEVSLEDFNRPADNANLVFLPKEFQLEGETFDERYTFVGPCLPARPDHPAGEDVVLASLGTTSNDHRAFFETCAAAFADGPWPAVMTLGAAVDPASLQPLPANVRAHRWLPHTTVLPSARVFVCQAGMGSLMEALSFGVPSVLVPYLPEQEFIARRAAELGLARMILPADLDVATLRATALDVAQDPYTRERVAWMRGCIRAAGGATRAADAVERAALGVSPAPLR